MRIGVSYRNGEVFQRCGHTEQFKVYETEGGEIRSAQVIEADGAGHGALAGQLGQMGVKTLICGGIGEGARRALAQMGVALYAGASGAADAAVEALLAGTLKANDAATCNHHGHEHGHDCGEHHGHDCGHHGHDCGGHHGCGGRG